MTLNGSNFDEGHSLQMEEMQIWLEEEVVEE